MRLRRTAMLALAIGTLHALAASAALGAAGGGSGGFSGGGGGGGGSGGGFGGGSGSGSGGSDNPWLLAFMLLGMVIFIIWSTLRSRRKRRAAAGTWDPAEAARRDRATEDARRERVERVARASLVAAEDDPYFASDTVVPQAETLFREVQTAWDARDEAALARLVAPDLMVEWSRRLADFARKGWHNVVRVHDPVRIEYVGLINREDDDEDRVVVRVSATLDDYVEDRGGVRMNHVGMDSSVATVREYWTLRYHDERWRLVSIEQDREGEYNLRTEVVADPADDGALADESMVEQALANRITDGVKIAELADLDFDGDALTAARDLSLVDQRFDPGVIEVAVRRAVAAWAEAVDGPDDALLELAGPGAVRSMLYPAGAENVRLVVRGPHVSALHVRAVDAEATPPEVHVEAEVEGVRFLEDRDTVVVVAGSNNERVAFVERWTLALDETSAEHPWRVTAAVPSPL